MDGTTPTPGTAASGLPPNIEKLIGQFVAVRDRKRLLEQQHKDQLKPFKEVMDQLEGQLLAYMQQTGSQSIATAKGTAYQSTKKSATIADGKAFRDFIVAHGLFDLIDWRANANHVFDYISEHKVQPPGLNCSTYTSVGFRSPSEK